ncbi:MAG: hypothetical protein V4527_11905 [Pseudomonadota bacterium]
MEAGKLTGPPAMTERVVQFLIPPQSRETVVGDLREIYRTPSQYMIEAARTVPLVILSCALRATNLPLLILQGGLVFYCLEGLSGHLLPLDQLRIWLATALALLAVIMRDTYRQAGRPSANRAILEAITIASFMIVFCSEAFGLKQARLGTPDFLLELQFATMLPLAIPALGVLRTFLIVGGDRDLDFFGDNTDVGMIARIYRRFVLRLRFYCLAEAAALIIFAVAMRIALHMNLLLVGLCALAALFLLFQSRSRPIESEDPLALRAEYRRQLLQQQQLRRFLWWLWATPILIMIYQQLIQAGISANRAVLVTLGSATMILICFLIGAVNRECAGRVQEKIELLERTPLWQ